MTRCHCLCVNSFIISDEVQLLVLPPREIATLTYRSGPEWEQRFNRKRIKNDEVTPSINPSFLIESYLDYQGEAACTKLDPNSLIYVSKVSCCHVCFRSRPRFFFPSLSRLSSAYFTCYPSLHYILFSVRNSACPLVRDK